ncbi:hypothetical protein [Streptomyces flavalbus]|uniref:Lipoprotein n=1 Tax=Streptomyces flavalbus TaxID=2665155 RepID=A0ABW2W7J5_9ACTN
MRRTPLTPLTPLTKFTALCLTAAATVALTGCVSGDDTADDKAAGKGGKADRSAASPASKSPEPFPDLTGGEIAERALDATVGAQSLRVTGDVPDESSGGTIRLDMAMDKDGECAGTLGMDGGKADLIRTGDTVYMRYDEGFLRAQGEGEPQADTDAAVALLAGKWTSMSATGEDMDEITGFCDLDTLLGGEERVHSDATRGRTTEVDGTPAIVLDEKDGKDRYTLYVATEGEPYLLRVDSTGADDPGALTFSDHDEPVRAERPTGEILDLDDLAG